MSCLTLRSQAHCIIQGIVFIGRSHRRQVQMAVAADSHLVERTMPFMDHNCTTRSRYMPFTHSSSSAFTASCNVDG